MSVMTLGRPLMPASPTAEKMPHGIALSAMLHVAGIAMILLGLPNLFRSPPPEEMPIAVRLVTIAPETRATKPNPYKPVPEAKPEPPVARPTPKPEPKPEPQSEARPDPVPAVQAPPVPAVQAPPVPPPPKPVEAQAAPSPVPPPPKPVEAQAAPSPVPPPPKPVEAQAAPPPPPPKPEVKPEPRPQPPQARPEQKKADPAAFDNLVRALEQKKPERKQQPAAFDDLLKNLTQHPSPPAEETPSKRTRVAAASPSSQPRAPLGAQLSASEVDLVREQISRCWNVPAGAREARDLVVEIRVFANPDGTVRQAVIVDQGRLADPFFRAAAESARRAFFNPLCTPLRLPQDKYEAWKNFVVAFSPKDLL